MNKQLIPLITPDMYRNLPDQTTEILNRLITEVNNKEGDIEELTNAVIVLQNQVKKLTPSPTPPTPQGEFQQVLNFDPALMGTTPGWCLQNTREGFGIQTGTFPTAYDDMLSQKQNGTLHEELYPPIDIAVPIYARTFIAGQHVMAWDHGVVYSDGNIIQDWVSYFGAENIYGWGELCDGVRVVVRTS